MTKVMMQKSTKYTKAQSTRLHSPEFWEDKAMTGRSTERGGKRLRSALATLSAGALMVGLLAPAVALANPITISKTHRCDSNPFASADGNTGIGAGGSSVTSNRSSSAGSSQDCPDLVQAQTTHQDLDQNVRQSADNSNDNYQRATANPTTSNDVDIRGVSGTAVSRAQGGDAFSLGNATVVLSRSDQNADSSVRNSTARTGASYGGNASSTSTGNSSAHGGNVSVDQDGGYGGDPSASTDNDGGRGGNAYNRSDADGGNGGNARNYSDASADASGSTGIGAGGSSVTSNRSPSAGSNAGPAGGGAGGGASSNAGPAGGGAGGSASGNASTGRGGDVGGNSATLSGLRTDATAGNIATNSGRGGDSLPTAMIATGNSMNVHNITVNSTGSSSATGGGASSGTATAGNSVTSNPTAQSTNSASNSQGSQSASSSQGSNPSGSQSSSEGQSGTQS